MDMGNKSPLFIVILIQKGCNYKGIIATGAHFNVFLIIGKGVSHTKPQSSEEMLPSGGVSKILISISVHLVHRSGIVRLHFFFFLKTRKDQKLNILFTFLFEYCTFCKIKSLIFYLHFYLIKT